MKQEKQRSAKVILEEAKFTQSPFPLDYSSGHCLLLIWLLLFKMVVYGCGSAVRRLEPRLE